MLPSYLIIFVLNSYFIYENKIRMWSQFQIFSDFVRILRLFRVMGLFWSLLVIRFKDAHNSKVLLNPNGQDLDFVINISGSESFRQFISSFFNNKAFDFTLHFSLFISFFASARYVAIPFLTLFISSSFIVCNVCFESWIGAADCQECSAEVDCRVRSTLWVRRTAQKL